MANRSVLYELNVDLGAGRWGVACPLDQTLTGPVQYGWDRYQKDPESMTFGGGLLAGSPLPGMRRMIFCGYSPQWEGFYVSALGGAMHVFHRFGVNYVWLRGRCSQESVLVLNLKDGEYSARLEPVDADALWAGYTDARGRTWDGFYALQRYAFETYRGEYTGDNVRVLAVGPAARRTNEGAIGSNAVKKGDLSVVDDWAGRGGLGSRLLQHHRLAAIVLGGDWQDPALREAKELDQYFLARFGQRAIAADLALSQKYRYVPEFETGGTFGVNMHQADDRLFSYNYTSIYASDAARLQQHDELILGHYLRQFNEEIIQPRSFDHCGEPCAIACKKFNGEFKKDYEPYEALGPQCGIFDQRAAERLNKYIDTLGWDAIQAGGSIAWVMELVAAGLLPAADFGLPAEGPRFPLTPALSQREKGTGQLPAGSLAQSKPPLPDELLAAARDARRQATDAEQLMWNLLRKRQLGGAKFRRQHPVPPYILDFYCHEASLAIELDGGVPALPEQAQRAAERTAALETQGIRVLRFGNDDVLTKTETVLETLRSALQARLSAQSPSSSHNADYALAVARMILFSEAGAPFRRGLRAAAKWLDARYDINSLDRAAFTAQGAQGCMVPNQYWTPGMFAPMPLMGKYFSYYENRFLPPRALGRKNVERFVYELYSENSGACRFHRKWVEDIVDEITLSHFDLSYDFWDTNFRLAKAIHDHQAAAAGFWESERVVDIIHGFLEKWERDGLREPELLAWLARFREDKWAAARAFWDEMRAGMAEAFAEGMTEPGR